MVIDRKKLQNFTRNFSRNFTRNFSQNFTRNFLRNFYWSLVQMRKETFHSFCTTLLRTIEPIYDFPNMFSNVQFPCMSGLLKTFLLLTKVNSKWMSLCKQSGYSVHMQNIEIPSAIKTLSRSAPNCPSRNSNMLYLVYINCDL